MAIDFQQANGIVGPLQKGGQSYFRSSDFGECVNMPGGSDYQEVTRQGFVFTARSSAAAAIPIFSTLTNSPTLWNAASSGKVVIPLLLELTPVTVGTPVLTGLELGWLKNTGDGVATGAPLVTFTNVAPVSNMIGRGAATTRFAHGTVTFTTQPSIYRDIAITHWLEGTAATGLMLNTQYDFKGTVIMPPGTAISIGSQVASSTTYFVSLTFAEIPQYLYYNQ
jgi:hypothetical protein